MEGFLLLPSAWMDSCRSKPRAHDTTRARQSSARLQTRLGRHLFNSPPHGIHPLWMNRTRRGHCQPLVHYHADLGHKQLRRGDERLPPPRTIGGQHRVAPCERLRGRWEDYAHPRPGAIRLGEGAHARRPWRLPLWRQVARQVVRHPLLELRQGECCRWRHAVLRHCGQDLGRTRQALE